MPDPIAPIVFACSCENTMTLDRTALEHAGGELRLATQLCRAGIGAVRDALAEGRPITIGCTQEAPLFQELADETRQTPIFANIRENAGWSAAARPGPKMAALLAAAQTPVPPVELVSLSSEGVTLILGRDETAIDVATRLADTLDVTVLLHRPGAVTPPSQDLFPVLRGSVRIATGHLGAFTLTIDDTVEAAPSSRAHLLWATPRNGATSSCDVILDLTGNPPLFPAHDLRPGYLRADPARPETIERLILEASRLTGTFDKPAYLRIAESLCAHSRNRKTGCTRCLDLCPTGAITPGAEHVLFDTAICAGCGACAAVCPTGAVTYALPPAEAVIDRLRVMLATYLRAGGTAPVILLHDEDHGTPLIEAAARFGQGLPDNLLPLRLNEVTQTTLGLIAAAYAYGATGLVALTRERPRHDTEALHRVLALAEAILRPIGLTPPTLLATDDPDALWHAAPIHPGVARPSGFLPLAQGRALDVIALKELHRAANHPPTPTKLPPLAPFGAIQVDTAGCTLCLACVATCPTGALRDDPDKPTLRFAEDACVQCGLCQATCPEKVITLIPRLDLAAWSAGPITLKQEEPYPCLTCGKPFGAKSTVERITQKLESHWMYTGPNAHRLNLIKMCEDCRIEASMNESLDPHARPV